jgi:phosphoribosylaminoimidazolecarboxamide formyltransferase/IMP cyclohydrolase
MPPLTGLGAFWGTLCSHGCRRGPQDVAAYAAWSKLEPLKLTPVGRCPRLLYECPSGFTSVFSQAGASAVAPPGGSIRDKDAIEAANRLGLAMMFTGVRHFRH